MSCYLMVKHLLCHRIMQWFELYDCCIAFVCYIVSLFLVCFFLFFYVFSPIYFLMMLFIVLIKCHYSLYIIILSLFFLFSTESIEPKLNSECCFDHVLGCLFNLLVSSDCASCMAMHNSINLPPFANSQHRRITTDNPI